MTNIKNNIIASLALALAITASGWAMSYENTQILLDNVVEQKNDNKKLSIEIANLEEVIVKKENDLSAKNMVIDERENQIGEQERKITLLRTEIAKLKEENKKRNPTSKIARGTAQYSLTVNASAYQSLCYEGCTGITATGYNVKNTIYYNGYRIVATDPKVIPLYSIIEIEGFNERFISLDTGGAIKGKKVDILMRSDAEANKFGRKNLKVNVIRKGR